MKTTLVALVTVATTVTWGMLSRKFLPAVHPPGGIFHDDLEGDGRGLILRYHPGIRL
jgi:hypothetical protein